MRLIRYKLLTISAIFVLIVAFSCNQDKKVNSVAVVKANIKGMEGKDVVLDNLSPLNLNADTAHFDENSQVVFNLKIEQPAYYSMAIGRTKLVIYVRPGDSVLLSGDASNILSSVRFSGDAPIYNDYLVRFNSISSAFQSQLMREFGQEEKVVTHKIDSVRALHADEIAALQKGNSNLDPYFLKIEKARILYEWAILYRLYPSYYNYIHRESDYKPSPEYDTYLAQTNLNDGDLVDLPLYISFLETYMRDVYDTYFEDSLDNQYPSFINYQLNQIDKKFSNQSIKSLMAYDAVKQQITYDGVKDMDTYWGNLNAMCKNKNLLADLDARLDKWSHLKKGMPAKDFTFVDISGKDVSLSDFKGKWVYIDIWATWCSPCMHEVPYLKTLEEELSGQNIVFMSISVDRTQDPWHKVVAEKEMKGVQLWAGQNDIIKDFYKVSGIPRFMIIDPEGNIYSSSADRPSNNVGEELKALLNTKE